jgi:hypothetical protein
MRDDHLDAYAEALAERIRTTIESVRDEVRDLPQDQAGDRLTEALGSDQGVLGERGIRSAVRHLKDPLWSLKHPLKARRERRGR